MKGIADTGFLVAFLNRRDRYFPWAYAVAETIREPLLTCEAVLAEASYHLRNSSAVLQLTEKGLVRLGFDLSQNQVEVAALADRYADHEPDLADLCLIRMSELNPALSIFTVDCEFQIYRRNRHQVIPVIMPGGKHGT